MLPQIPTLNTQQGITFRCPVSNLNTYKSFHSPHHPQVERCACCCYICICMTSVVAKQISASQILVLRSTNQAVFPCHSPFFFTELINVIQGAGAGDSHSLTLIHGIPSTLTALTIFLLHSQSKSSACIQCRV